jgi:hypothetical protein
VLPPGEIVLRAAGMTLAGNLMYFASWFSSSKPAWIPGWIFPTAGIVGVIVSGMGAALIGAYTAAILISRYFSPMQEFELRVLVSVAAVLGLWGGNIGAQMIANLARKVLGEKTTPIEWIRGWPRKRKSSRRRRAS